MVRDKWPGADGDGPLEPPMFPPENPLVWVPHSADAPTGAGTHFPLRMLVAGPRVHGGGRDVAFLALKTTALSSLEKA